MSAAATNTGAQSSAELFAAHHRAELEADINSLDGYIRTHMVPNVQLKQHYSPTKSIGNTAMVSRLLRQFGQTLIFGYDGKGDLNANVAAAAGAAGSSKHASKKSLAPAEMTAALIQALNEKFGLSNESFAAGPLVTLHAAVVEKLSRILHSTTGHIDFKELFTNITPVADGKHRGEMNLPVKLEICSGAGDWAARQARADVGKANWVALELRCDRSSAALRKHMFLSSGERDSDRGRHNSDDSVGLASNLAVVSGDAVHVLHTRVAPNSVAAMFVNHPEPPERSMLVDKRAGSKGSAKDSNIPGSGSSKVQGHHLLMPEFLRDCCRALLAGPEEGEIEVIPEKTEQSGKRRQSKQRSAGCLTIVTDSLPYAKILADSFASLAPVTHAVDGEEEEEEEEDGSESHKRRRKETTGSNTPSTSTSTNASSTASAYSAKYVFQSVPLSSESDDDDSDDDGGGVSGGAAKLEHRVPVSSHDLTASTTTLGKSVRDNVISVWRGDIVTAGVRDVVSASSYFDRMWSAGDKKRRWFIHLRKVRI